MLIPISTDAPIYHFPFACIGLIVANVVGFALSGMGSIEHADRWRDWILVYGDGLHPVQWITSNFVHMGFMHLIGNMLFLWGFGIVVEGKLGWWRFLLIYMAIGVGQCAVEQTLMLGYSRQEAMQEMLGELLPDPPSEEEVEIYRQELVDEGWEADEVDQMVADYAEGETLDEVAPEVSELIDALSVPGSCGASSIIFGLLAMSLVWAPKNEMTFLMFLGVRVITFEASIMAFSCWYLGLEVLTALLQGFAIATSTLHLMGAIAGFGVGTLLLKKHTVDCEDWDLFAVMSGNYGPWARDRYGYRITPEQRQQEAAANVKPADEKKKRSASVGSSVASKKKADEIHELVESGQIDEAIDEAYNLRLRDRKAILREDTLRQLSTALLKEQRWEEAIEYLRESSQHYPDTADSIRMRLAYALMKGMQDYRGAIKVLKQVNREVMDDDAKARFQHLARWAKDQKEPPRG